MSGYSDQIGIYCTVEKVVLAPDDAKPTTAQVWGAFSFAIPGSFGRDVPANGFGISGDGSIYGPVQVGYLYYTCAAATETPANPDVYPLNIGVIPVGRPNPGQYPDLIKALAAALAKK